MTDREERTPLTSEHHDITLDQMVRDWISIELFPLSQRNITERLMDRIEGRSVS